MPFHRMDSDEMPVPVLAQTGRKEFEICGQFRYVRDGEVTVVPKEPMYARTDLASIPGLLLWFVPRYGRHTLAALLHDQLVKDSEWDRVDADSRFRDALGELDVPLLRRWIMWAAVSIGTKWDAGGFRRIMAVVWTAIVVSASYGIWHHTPWPGVAAPWPLIDVGRLIPTSLGLGPIAGYAAIMVVAGLVLLKMPRPADWLQLALVGAFAVWLLLIPTFFVVLASLAYAVIDVVFRGAIYLVNRWGRRNLRNNAVLMSRAEPVGVASVDGASPCDPYRPTD